MIEVIGVSVPVWFHKGSTSEPAREVFCKYKIINKNENVPIFRNKTGYEINLPKYIDGEKKLVIKKLLDKKDGGEECIRYKEYNKVMQNKIYYNLIHYVEIFPKEKLNN